MKDHWKSRFKAWLHFLKVALVWMRYLQVPLVAAAVGAGLALFVVVHAGPYALVVGAYDGVSQQVITVALVAILYSFALWEMAKVIWTQGPDRFNLQDAEVRFTHGIQHQTAKAVLWVLFASVPVLTYKACTIASELPWFGWLIWVLVYAALGWGHHKGMPWAERKIENWISNCRLFGNLRAPGYRALPEKSGLAVGHVKQGIMLVFCGLVSVGVWKLVDPGMVPAAVYVLLIVLGLAWVCAALGFFFWRYHVPLFLVLGLWVVAGGWWFHKDYEYRVVRLSEKKELPTAKEILEFTPERRIAVAAVGGGIHSGAWAMEVLTRLQDIEGGEKLPDRLCALSGTSGGSYGLMHYAHAIYHGTREKRDLAKLTTAAQFPSLGAVVSAMAYHDLPSYFAPLWATGKDRGTAMEAQWAENARLAGVGMEEDLSKVTLADWGEQARDGRMPAVIFTSGTEESGRPTIYGSSKVWDWNWNAEQERAPDKGCPFELRDYTVPVVTGARLSATFPFVSPVARPAADARYLRRVQHQMDGGYYDNYGLVALNRWLEEGLRAADPDDGMPEADKHACLPPDFRHFLVIQIRYHDKPDAGRSLKKGGFFYQTTAPLTGLYNARVAGQRLRADEQFDIFCRYWARRGVTIENAAFEFDVAEGAALSWHLTAADRAELTRQGEKLVADSGKYSEAADKCDALFGIGAISKEEAKKHMEDLRSEYPNGEAASRVMKFMKSK